MTLKLPKRTYAQYAAKPKLMKWLNVAHDLGKEVADGADQVRKSLDIDTARGESLRIISRIVAVEAFKKETLMNAGVFADPDGTQWNELEQTFASWSTQTDANLSDELLRTICRAKILKNTLTPTTKTCLTRSTSCSRQLRHFDCLIITICRFQLSTSALLILQSNGCWISTISFPRRQASSFAVLFVATGLLNF